MSKKTIIIRPKSIKPDYSSTESVKNKNNAIKCASVHQGMKYANNICSDNNNIAYWGERFPNKGNTNNWLRYYANTVSSFSGSYNKPSPFNTSGWQGLEQISNNAKIKKVKVHYRIAHVRYIKASTYHHGRTDSVYTSEGGYYYYSELPSSKRWGKKSSCQINYLISLHGLGNTRSESGNGLHRSQMISKNADTYSKGDLGEYSTTLYDDANGNYTMSQFKNSYIRFIMPRQLGDDVSRIIMRDLWVELTYEDASPKFQIDTLTINPSTTTNCPNDSTTVTVKIKSANNITKDTKVELSGAGITNANISEIKHSNSGNKFQKEDGNYIWTVKEFSGNTATLKFTVKYSNHDNGRTWNIKAQVKNYADSSNASKTATIKVNNCKPTFTFDFLKYNDDGNHTSMKDYIINGKYTFKDTDGIQSVFVAKLTKMQELNHVENVTIDMNKLELNKIYSYSNTKVWQIKHGDTDITNKVTIKIENDKYVFTGLKEYLDDTITFTCHATLENSGNYRVEGSYNNLTQTGWSQSISYNIKVLGSILPKEYFTLRLEDGSDVKYNSLMITEGDDLLTPITYTSEKIEDYTDDMVIIGEKKRIPVGETQYIKFNITLDRPNKDITLKKVLAYIDVSASEDMLDDIIVGASKNATILESDNNKICVIDSISSNTTTTVKLAVKSDIEIEDVVIKLKPYNYDRYDDEHGWIPAHVMFKDIPNIKISIDGISDLMYDDSIQDNPKSYFWLYYNIQNLSDIDAKKIRFQLKEPNQFKKISVVSTDTELHFNEKNRIITFDKLEKNSKKYILAVKYQATQKGIYNFIIHTLDDVNDLEDDQYSNSYQHMLMVNIDSEVRIKTDVSNSLPYVNELFDFHINVKNLYKKQKKFVFDIYDIGSYGIEHNTNDYYIEYVNCKHGTFEPSNEENKVGQWILTDIDAGDEFDLTLSVRPQDTGNHFFKTIFINQSTSKDSKRDFYNEVKVLERNKQLDFNVYHAIDEKGTGCKDCDSLTEICDDDFINLGDEIYYVLELTNNSRNAINKNIHIYARLPDSFLTNKIICSSRNYVLNQDNNLIHFTIPNLSGCKKDDSTIKFCFKVKPDKIGKFTSNFTLTTRNSSVLYKQLKLTVDSEFAERKLEHEINIYNFEKTNKYYRYETDNIGNIFKFFNTGDKTYRPVRTEHYNKSAVETYRGTNLREIVRNIKDNSKYVDPVLLREGANQFADKGYELYPDGLMRRFGLLNSEIFHYSNQFPRTTDLVLKAMKWDIDMWDTKLWASDKYNNGVFDLTIDYSKVPTNFNILEVDNPIKNLQNLVDNTKPYGTKAFCYYSASVRASFAMNIDVIKSEFQHSLKVFLSMPNDFDMITECNRHDNSLIVYYDLTRAILSTELDIAVEFFNNQTKDPSRMSSNIPEISTGIYYDNYKKTYARDCYYLISNTYNGTENEQNIDVVKPAIESFSNQVSLSDDGIHHFTSATNDLQSSNQSTVDLSNILFINFLNKLTNKEMIGLTIQPYKDTTIYTHNDINGNIAQDDRQLLTDNTIKCVFYKDDINAFQGFRLIVNNEINQERNIIGDVNTVSIQIQTCDEENNQILHFWGSINGQEYYHIGHVIINNFIDPTAYVFTDTEHKDDCDIKCYVMNDKDDLPIKFQISDQIRTKNKDFNTIRAIENKNKWQYLKRINNGKSNRYAYFENKINIDPECLERAINIPKLVLKYNDLNIYKHDEIVDIKFKIEAQSNKEDFQNDININLYKDGDAYIAEDNIARQNYYPSKVTNVNQEFLTTINVEQTNTTICSECLKTSLGYLDKCPYCGSTHVRHYSEPQSATACYNCGWIIDGWHDYCQHCLSYNVEKIQIDFNKTYCNKCHSLSNNYYERCPQCFSSDVVHLTNNTTKYQIFDKETQNIKPISIHADNQIVNLFNLEIPLNRHTKSLQELEYLKLHIAGKNNNLGEYYYCEACNSGGLGNYEKCPYCGSSDIHNEKINNNVLEVYLQANGKTNPYSYCKTCKTHYNGHYSICPNCGSNKIEYNNNTYAPEIFLLSENFDIPLNIYTKDDENSYANINQIDNFKLLCYIENKSYNKIIKDILALPIKDKHQAEILQELPLLNIDVNNIYFDYKYINENEWVGLDRLQGENHSFIKYDISNYQDKSDAINFSNFDLPNGEYLHANLYISGVTKKAINSKNYIAPVMNVYISNNGKIFNEKFIITESIFNINFDITTLVGQNLQNVSVKIDFNNISSYDSINITDCHITTAKHQYKDIIHDSINEVNSQSTKEHNYYLIESIDNSLWGLNKTAPYYLSGKHLETNLIAYIDFGKLNLEEYLRIYNIEMIIYYKTKTGKVVTETITQDPDNKIQNKAITDGLLTIDEDSTEQILQGEINAVNGELIGSVNYPTLDLNNLEYEVNTINEDDDLVNDIPLYYQLAQSFTIESPTDDNKNNYHIHKSTTISTISLNYFGKRGYPNNIINVHLCEDNNNQPGNIIQSNKVTMPNANQILNVDLDIIDLNTNTKYWIVLEDISADINNYHRFKYNGNVDVGELIHYNNGMIYDNNRVLSFSIDKIDSAESYWFLPTTWRLDLSVYDSYKIYNNLYRYNVQDGSNVSLSNLNIKNGYYLIDTEPIPESIVEESHIDEDEVENNTITEPEAIESLGNESLLGDDDND